MQQQHDGAPDSRREEGHPKCHGVCSNNCEMVSRETEPTMNSSRLTFLSMKRIQVCNSPNGLTDQTNDVSFLRPGHLMVKLVDEDILEDPTTD